MAEKIKFELVSPERLLLDSEADMVVVPGSDGYFGALKGHVPMVSGIEPGVIDIHDGGKIVDRIFVAGGFAEVSPERITILAEEAIKVSDIDATAAATTVRDLESDLAAAAAGDRARLEAKLTIARARLGAAR